MIIGIISPSDGFFWGQQFQEEQVKEYKAQDEEFLKWAKEQFKEGRKYRIRLFLVKF